MAPLNLKRTNHVKQVIWKCVCSFGCMWQNVFKLYALCTVLGRCSNKTSLPCCHLKKNRALTALTHGIHARRHRAHDGPSSKQSWGSAGSAPKQLHIGKVSIQAEGNPGPLLGLRKWHHYTTTSVTYMESGSGYIPHLPLSDRACPLTMAWHQTGGLTVC